MQILLNDSVLYRKNYVEFNEVKDFFLRSKEVRDGREEEEKGNLRPNIAIFSRCKHLKHLLYWSVFKDAYQ